MCRRPQVERAGAVIVRSPRGEVLVRAMRRGAGIRPRCLLRAVVVERVSRNRSIGGGIFA